MNISGITNLNIVRKTNFETIFVFSYNIENYTFEAKIKDVNNVEVGEFECVNNHPHHLHLRLTKTQTENLTGEDLSFDVIQTSDVNFKIQIIKGQVTFEDTITL